MKGYEIVRCSKCNDWIIVEPPKEPMPQDLMQKTEIKKCSCKR